MSNKNRDNILGKLAGSENELVAFFAKSLIAKELDDDELREILSLAAEKIAAHGPGLAAAMSALVEIDGELSVTGVTQVPWATKLASFMAERILHAFEHLQQEQHQNELATISPIVKIDKRTLLAAPVGKMEPETLARFCDRILVRTQLKKFKQVHLLLGSKSEDDAYVWSSLEQELAAQKVRLERSYE